MLRLTGAVAILCAFALSIVTAEAKTKAPSSPVTAFCGDRYCPQAPAAVPVRAGREHHRHVAARASARLDRNYCQEDTAAGTITIACNLVGRMSGFIADVVARGFKGRVTCLSYSPSHVARSLHKIGEACDFAQRGWGKTVRPMYHVADLAAKWGLRDGCTFRDCGHIDSGRIRTARRDRHKQVYEAVADSRPARGSVQ